MHHNSRYLFSFLHYSSSSFVFSALIHALEDVLFVLLINSHKGEFVICRDVFFYYINAFHIYAMQQHT